LLDFGVMGNINGGLSALSVLIFLSFLITVTYSATPSLASDSAVQKQVMLSSSNIFDSIVSFFKSLFGIRSQNITPIPFQQTNSTTSSVSSTTASTSTSTSTTSVLPSNILCYNTSGYWHCYGGSPQCSTTYCTCTAGTPNTCTPNTLSASNSIPFNIYPYPTSGGSVTPTPGNYPRGSSITIGASPNPGYAFLRWYCYGTGCYNGTTTSTQVTLNNPITEIASFASSSTTIQSTSINSTTTGTSTSTSTTSVLPSNIPCYNTSGYWHCSGESPQCSTTYCTCTAGTPNTCTPNALSTNSIPFNIYPYPTSGGSVTPTPGNYPKGSSITIGASPNPGYTFLRWYCYGTGCYNGTTTSTQVTLNNPITEIATFVHPTLINFSTNVTYTNEIPKVVNSVTVNSLSVGVTQNISASMGVSILEMENSIYKTTNGITIRFGCRGCNQTSVIQPNSIIEGFVFNGTITNSILSRLAASNPSAIIAQNKSAFRQFVSNYTPSGFTPIFNTSNITQQNATAYRAQWVATSNASSSYVNISAFRAISSDPTLANSVTLSDRIAAPYIADTFNNTDVVNRTIQHEIYISHIISGNNTNAKYIPSNITTYKTDNAVVISATDVVKDFTNHISIQKSTVLIRNISLSVKQNFTATAISIRSYSANELNLTGRRLPNLAGRIGGYLFINSTINDPSIKAVNYTFNETPAWFVQHSLDPHNFSMYRLNATTNTWTKLNTVLISSNASTLVYKASSPGISKYAFAGGYLYTSMNTTTGFTTVATTTIAQAPPPSVKIDITYVALVVAALLIIFAVVYVYHSVKAGGEKPPESPPQTNNF